MSATVALAHSGQEKDKIQSVQFTETYIVQEYHDLCLLQTHTKYAKITKSGSVNELIKHYSPCLHLSDDYGDHSSKTCVLS